MVNKRSMLAHQQKKKFWNLKIKTIKYLGLETRMQGGQEGMVGRQRQDALLRHGALNVVVLDDDVLFEDFDGKYFFCVPLFCQHHFAEGAFAQDFEEPKIFQRTLDFAALPIHDFFECCHFVSLIITVRFHSI